MATLTEEVRQPIQSAIYAKAFQMAPHLDVDGVALLRYVKMTEQSCKSLNCLVRTHKYSTSPFSDKKVEDFYGSATSKNWVWYKGKLARKF